MTTNTKQTADFLAVNEYIEKNEGVSKKMAIAEAAKNRGCSVSTVTANYYREARKQNAPLLQRRPRKATKKTAKNLTLNGVRNSLNDALKLIDQMEKRNAELEKKIQLIKSL
jgi:hypothetical protein